MSDAPHSGPHRDDAQSSSFSHAFLPGLILGLVVGGVSGAFLPDLLNPGPRIPAATGHPADGERDRDETPGDEMELPIVDDEGVPADDQDATQDDEQPQPPDAP